MPTFFSTPIVLLSIIALHMEGEVNGLRLPSEQPKPKNIERPGPPNRRSFNGDMSEILPMKTNLRVQGTASSQNLIEKKCNEQSPIDYDNRVIDTSRSGRFLGDKKEEKKKGKVVDPFGFKARMARKSQIQKEKKRDIYAIKECVEIISPSRSRYTYRKTKISTSTNPPVSEARTDCLLSDDASKPHQQVDMEPQPLTNYLPSINRGESYRESIHSVQTLPSHPGRHLEESPHLPQHGAVPNSNGEQVDDEVFHSVHPSKEYSTSRRGWIDSSNTHQSPRVGPSQPIDLANMSPPHVAKSDLRSHSFSPNPSKQEVDLVQPDPSYLLGYVQNSKLRKSYPSSMTKSPRGLRPESFTAYPQETFSNMKHHTSTSRYRDYQHSNPLVHLAARDSGSSKHGSSMRSQRVSPTGYAAE
ncbi:unnamed protein product [Albugo candida]|uniref:RxLR effector protein n=1 Tax=Albugo candida TaxID=65357 RepID=A0A024GAA2_9STRA|nr:unnamed protein product [Albugo candida]|eukprot:CCI43698.1 unnamed protein product [Albugo candida]